MNLHTLKPPPGSVKGRKRIGRGQGSGYGKTAGKGSKGQKCRSGYSRKPGFEGGQMPLIRRIPKRGFTNIFRKVFAEVNVADLSRFEAGSVVTPEELRRAKLVKQVKDGIKVLGRGDISIPITVKAHKFSKSAREKIVGAGGQIEVLK